MKWVVPIIAFSVICVFLAAVFLSVAAIFGMAKSTVPYQEALAKAVANPQVQAALGTPVTAGFLVSGNISTAGASGSASMEIPISGPKGKGNIHVEAKKSAGVWTYSSLEVTIPGQPERVQLPR